MLPLLPHQKQGVRYILSHSSAFVCDDMGMGKTRTVIEAMVKRGAYPIVVVCPTSLKLNWKEEIMKWTGISTEIDDYTQAIIITNYERMSVLDKLLPTLKVQQLIFDECHVLKNKDAKRTKLAMKWGELIPYKILMTGTPLLNRPTELISQLTILGLLRSQFGGEQQFKKDYATLTGLNKLHKKLKKLWLRRKKGDLKEKLPLKQIVPIAITTLQQPKVESFEDVERQDRQVLEKKLPHSIEFIQEVMNRGEKLVVFVHHRSVGERLLQAFPTASYIVGGQSAKDRQANVERFQHGDVQLIICSLVASAVGLTLTAARIAVFLEYPWSPTLLRQAQDRIHRIGQEKDVIIYYLYAKGSIDEYRLDTNHFKETIIDYIVEEHHE